MLDGVKDRVGDRISALATRPEVSRGVDKHGSSGLKDGLEGVRVSVRIRVIRHSRVAWERLGRQAPDEVRHRRFLGRDALDARPRLQPIRMVVEVLDEELAIATPFEPVPPNGPDQWRVDAPRTTTDGVNGSGCGENGDRNRTAVPRAEDNVLLTATATPAPRRAAKSATVKRTAVRGQPGAPTG